MSTQSENATATARRSLYTVAPGRVVRLAAIAMIIVAAFALAGAAISWLSATLERTAYWANTVKISRSGSGVAQLFHALVKKGIISYHPETALIATLPCDYAEQQALLETPEPGWPQTGQDSKAAYLNRLCNTGQGHAIREQINIWNSGFSMLAVRDDRPDSWVPGAIRATHRRHLTGQAAAETKKCPRAIWRAGRRNARATTTSSDYGSSDYESGLYRPKGCTPSVWQAKFAVSSSEHGAANFLDANAEQIDEAPAPQLYGFFAEKALQEAVSTKIKYRRAFGDWFRLNVVPGTEYLPRNGAVPVNSASYRLETRLPPRKRQVVLRLQLIGELIRVWLNKTDMTKRVRTHPRCVRLIFSQKGNRRITRQVACTAKTAPEHALSPRGIAFELVLPASRRPQTLALDVIPVRGLPASLSAFRNARFTRADAIGPQLHGTPESPFDIDNQIPRYANTSRDENGAQAQTNDKVILQEAPETVFVSPENDNRQWHGLDEDESQPLGNKRSFQFASKIKVVCGSDVTASKDIKLCRLRWAGVGRPQRARKPRLQVVAGDGTTLLTDRQGRLNRLGFDLGLAPIIGYAPSDSYGLTGQVLPQIDQSADIPTVALTIDPKAQAMANWLVRSLALKTACRNKKRSGVPQKQCLAYIYNKIPANSSWRKQRRISLVLMDAGSGTQDAGNGTEHVKPGDIIASATWPNLPMGLHEWDISGNDVWDPAASPLAARGWSQSDKFTVPGSTFKVVTALAALQKIADAEGADATTEDRAQAQKLWRAITGVGPRHLRSVLGIGWNARYMPYEQFERGRIKGTEQSPPGLQDAHKGALGPNAIRNNLSFCRSSTGAKDGSTPILGLCEALKRSSNMWFARLALETDQASLSDGNREIAGFVQDFALSRVTRRLVPAATHYNLIAPFSARAGARVCLNAPYLQSEHDIKPFSRWQTLALNGIGQAVQVTPLAMASIMASLGSRQIVRPRLLRSELSTPPNGGGRKAVPPRDCGNPDGETARQGDPLLEGVSPKRADELLAPLAKAMRAVVQGKIGTAYYAFHPSNTVVANAEYRRIVRKIAPYVSAKTGTATNSKDLPSSAWLTGFVDPIPGSGITRRMAFTCSVTLSKTGGGGMCGPIVARMLACLHSPEKGFCAMPGLEGKISKAGKHARGTKHAL